MSDTYTSLYNTSVVKDTAGQVKLLYQRIDLVVAAYPALKGNTLRVNVLTESLNNSAQLEQMLEIFTLQGWAKLSLQEPPYTLLRLELLPTTDKHNVITQLRSVLGGQYSGLWAYEDDPHILLSGETSTVLNRLGLFYPANCWQEISDPPTPELKPITPELLNRLKERSDFQIARILKQPRAALDLILSN